MASSLAVHSSSATMVGGGGHRAHRRQRTALLRHRVRRDVGRGHVACILLVHVGLHDHERRGDRGRGVHRRAVARRRADGDGWPTQAGVAGLAPHQGLLLPPHQGRCDFYRFAPILG